MHISETDAEQFATEFVNLDGLIDRFAHSLAPVSTAPDAHTASKLLLVHTLACVASNQLHKRFRQGDAPVANKDYAAAISVTTALDALTPAQVGFVNPIFAVRRKDYGFRARMLTGSRPDRSFGHQLAEH